MEIKDLRKKEINEINKALADEQKKLIDYLMDIRIGKETKTHKVKEMRKSIAQMLTVKKEKEILNG